MNSKAFVRVNPRRTATEEYYAIMLMCSQLLFNFNALNCGLLSFEDSQVMVYSHFKDHPIFLGTGNLQVNMKWVMHCFSFFHRHMMFEEALTLWSEMQDLPICQSPSAWQEPLKDGPYKLPRYWKGTYSYLDLDELRRIRALAEEGGGNFIDMNIDTGTAIQVSIFVHICKLWTNYFDPNTFLGAGAMLSGWRNFLARCIRASVAVPPANRKPAHSSTTPWRGPHWTKIP